MADRLHNKSIVAWDPDTSKHVPVSADSTGALNVNVTGGGSGGGAVTVANGADVTEGSTTDVAVTGDNSGTISAKFRGLSKILADVWDSVNHWLKVSIQNTLLGAAQDVTNLISGGVTVSVQYAAVAISSSGASTIVAAVPLKRIKVIGYVLIANGAVNAKFQSHVTPTDLTGLFYLNTNTGVSASFMPVGHFQSEIGEALDLNLSANVAVGGHITYVTV